MKIQNIQFLTRPPMMLGHVATGYVSTKTKGVAALEWDNGWVVITFSNGDKLHIADINLAIMVGSTFVEPEMAITKTAADLTKSEPVSTESADIPKRRGRPPRSIES